jgi:hypothetical protein
MGRAPGRVGSGVGLPSSGKSPALTAVVNILRLLEEANSNLEKRHSPIRRRVKPGRCGEYSGRKNMKAR